MIGENGLFLGIDGQTTFFSDVMRDETALGFVGRQDALVYAEYMDGVEVDIAGFKHTHDLKSVGAATVEP